MCFYIHKTNTEKKVAAKDIVSFKILRRFKNDNRYYSQHKVFEYVPGEELPEVMLGFGKYGEDGMDYTYTKRKTGLRTGDIIEEGYHSWSSIDRALFEFKGEKNSIYLICKFIIPAGAEYYYNPEDNEYVSTKIKFVGPSAPYMPRFFKRLLGKMVSVKAKLY